MDPIARFPQTDIVVVHGMISVISIQDDKTIVIHFCETFHSLYRLTSYVIRSFGQARDYIYISPNVIMTSVNWIIRNQRKDGSFREMNPRMTSSIKV